MKYNKGNIIAGLIIIGAFVLTGLGIYRTHEEQVITQDRIAQLQTKSNDAILGAYNVTGGGTYRLKNSVGLSDTTINLSSFKEPVSDLPYTMTYLNTSIEYATIDPQTSHSEFISFTGITQNSNGSAQITGVTRGLTRTPAGASCTASTTLAQRHSGQAGFIISDSPCHFSEYAVKKNDETITGYWKGNTPLSSTDFAIKSYVDGIVNGGAVSNSAVAVAGTAGETVATGTVVYLKQSDGRWYKAGVTIAEASTTLLGISQGNGTSGVAIASGVLLSGLDSGQSGLTIGANYFLGSTAGTPGTATSSRILGRARTTTSLYFNTSYQTEGFLLRNGSDLSITASSTTFTNTASSSVVITATSSLKLGAFPAYNIGKNSQLITTLGTSTFSVPVGITKLYVKAVGGGGGGGGVNSSGANSSASGGTSGSYAEGFIDVTGTSSIQVFIGAGGGISIGASGADGRVASTTSFGTNGFYILAPAGVGGQGTGTTAATIGLSQQATLSTGGFINIAGQSGATAFSATAGGEGGRGGSNPLGFGGLGGKCGAGNVGADATSYGGGGGGACASSGTGAKEGGLGYQGAILVIW